MATQGDTRTRVPVSLPADVLEATHWRPGQEPTPLDPESTDFDDGIAWFDLKSGGNPTALHEFLAPRCEGLTVEMLTDLLRTDPDRPESGVSDDRTVRLASTFAVYPTATENGRGDWSCPVPSAELLYQPVELVSNTDWLLTCWHPTEHYRGYSLVGEPETPRDHGDVCRGVAKRWERKNAATAADLGVLVMHELALTYAPAHRQLYSALEEWELELYGVALEGEDEKEPDSDLPRHLWSARARLLDWLNPLNIPGIKKDIDKAWLPATDHKEVDLVDDRVDRALEDLTELGINLRSAFHSLQLRGAERQRDRNEVRQQRIERMAALFLIPTLIVGFYGANTWVPGEQRHWGFWVMIVIILLLTWLGWSLIARLHSQDNINLPKLSWLARSEKDRDRHPGVDS